MLQAGIKLQLQQSFPQSVLRSARVNTPAGAASRHQHECKGEAEARGWGWTIIHLHIITYIHFLFRLTTGSSAIFVSDGSFLKSCVLVEI